MKNLSFFLLIFFTPIGFRYLMGQSIEVFGGGNRNNFYDFAKNEGHFNKEYNAGFGYSLGFCIESFYVDTHLFPIKLVLCVNNYKGKINVSNGGLGGGSATTAEVTKNIAGLRIFPLTIKIIYSKVQVSIGGEFSILLNEKTTGFKSSWRIGGPFYMTTLENSGLQINSKFYFGIITRLAYDIRLKNNWFIVPQYFFYLGLTNEFINIEAKTKSQKQYLTLGIKKQFY